MDELKELWKKEQGGKALPKEEKVSFLSSKNTLIEKMKKSLYWEDMFNKVFSVAVFIYLVYTKEYMYSAVFNLIIIPVIWYYRFLINEINKFTYETEVKSYLKNIYRLLRTFVLRYRAFGIVVVPISFIYGFYLGYSTDPDPSKILEPLTILIVILGMLFFYGLVELYIYLLYGRLLKKLKELLLEIEG
ncbi:MAG: hypothetical protein BalsKO_26380 [Balneolaceae bacterium]